MEISGKLPPLDKTAYASANGTTARVEKQAAVTAAGADRVELSPRARELQAAREAVSKMDDMDHEKIARIRAQIETGTYKVDAMKVAGKMINESLLGDLK